MLSRCGQASIRSSSFRSGLPARCGGYAQHPLKRVQTLVKTFDLLLCGCSQVTNLRLQVTDLLLQCFLAFF